MYQPKLNYGPHRLEKSDTNDLVEELEKASWKVKTRNGEKYYASGPHAGKKVGSVRGKGPKKKESTKPKKKTTHAASTKQSGSPSANAAILDLLQISDAQYNDINKVTYTQTPKGNWRLYYDGKDTGLTVDKKFGKDLKASGAKTEAEKLINDIGFEQGPATERSESPRQLDDEDLRDAYDDLTTGDARNLLDAGAITVEQLRSLKPLKKSLTLKEIELINEMYAEM